MFISSNEKQYFHDTLNDLNRKIIVQAEIHQNQINSMIEENKRLSERLNLLVAGNIAKTAREENPPLKTPTKVDKEVMKQRQARSREYAKRYYWRKKAERIADGSKEKIRGHKGVENVSENTNNTSV
jgi:predicted TIM-barrel fold metal-dependent hydrolase